MPNRTPLGFQQLSVTSAATSTLTVPTGASLAVIWASQLLRYRDDGTPPISTSGVGIPATTQFEYQGNLAKLQLIAVSTTAQVDIAYYDYDMP